MTALELAMKLESLMTNKAKVDAMIAALKEKALEVEMAKGTYDEEINGLVRDLIGTDTGEVHLTEIMQKVLTLK